MRSPTVATKLQRIAEQADRDPDWVFTTLAHLIDEDFLREAYRRTSKSSAPGIDGVTAQTYAEHLDENLRDLHERLRSGRYQAAPVERVWIEKDDGGQRPIGKPAFEDKIVQRAVAMLLEAIYEQDFYDCSYGFRPGRSPHEALHELREQCMAEGIGWIVDADVSGYFDSIDRTRLREMLRKRINDGSILRLIGKWLRAGVMEQGALRTPRLASCKAASSHLCWPMFSSIMSWMPGSKVRYGHGCRADAFSFALPMTLSSAANWKRTRARLWPCSRSGLPALD